MFNTTFIIENLSLNATHILSQNSLASKTRLSNLKYMYVSYKIYVSYKTCYKIYLVPMLEIFFITKLPCIASNSTCFTCAMYILKLHVYYACNFNTRIYEYMNICIYI